MFLQTYLPVSYTHLAADLTGSLMLLAVCAMFLLTLSAKDMDFTKKKC